ncbi:probable RNA polymerase II nuclear localization protein SLC7A6OS [Copidosoma floridanum]|uniref:probable RNA polymerase II nuclear localization protein SLC7A6OS n=1 Tax=Copidosoma floridanum TaxID=29053 RepID=UPI0006C991A2|nr:probable RNA polymerase II nuclear localization protein SLC7A6OS [Copidosoma floridanum]
MAAILRVKRKKDDEPQDAFLISCKRAKVEDEAAVTEQPLTALVKFAGTVEKTEDCVVEHITKSLSKNYLKANYKQHLVDVTQKIREKTKQESNENRFKVVNNIRSIDSVLAGPLDEDVVNIIDIEDTKVDTDDKNDDGFVYDLYYTQTKEDLTVDNLLSVLPIEEEELVFEDHYRDERERDGETSDSNSESNRRNEYPDSDDCNDDVDEDDDNDSIGETAIRRALQRIGIDEDDDLSSDDEDFVYGLDEKDVDEYGYKYAKYKAQLKQEEEGDSNDSYDEDSDVDKDDFGEGYEMTITDD